MVYADNKEKQRGIAREPFVAERIASYFKKQGMSVTMQKSSVLEDMRKKYDYSYSCPESQSFAKSEKLHEIKVDIKCGKSFTLFDEQGRNTLEHSESTFIVYELYEGANLIWINTEKLKECLKVNPPQLRLSKYNNSQYFFIENYLRENRKRLARYYKEYKG